jgi:hypothetical protein
MKRALVALVGIAFTATVSVPAHAMKIIVESSALSDILDSINQDGSTSIDVNEDQYLNGDDWTIPGDDGAAGVAIETGDAGDGPALAASARAPALLAGSGAGPGPLLTFGIYDFTDAARRVGLLETGDPEGAPFEVVILDDGTVFVNNEETGVAFAANRFGFFLTDGVTTRYSDWHLNPEMGVHAVFFAGNGDVLDVEGLSPGPFRPGQWIIAWEFGDLAEGTRFFDDFVVLIDTVRSPDEVPEPGALVLLALGLIGLAIAMRRRRRNH